MEPTQYVMGLIFDTTDRVLLIKKKRPTHQVGKWNGLGGKVEDNYLSIENFYKIKFIIFTKSHHYRYCIFIFIYTGK